jgi:hypothetical protein
MRRRRSSPDTIAFHRWAHPPQMKKQRVRISSAIVT